MQYELAKKYSNGQQLLIFIGLLLAGTFFASLIQQISIFLIVPSNISIKDLESELPRFLKDPANVQYLRILQFISTFLMLFLPAFFFSRIVIGKGVFWLGFNRYINIIQIALGALIIFIANVMASPLEDLTKLITAHLPAVDAWAAKLENSYNESVLAMGVIRSWPEFILALLIMAFFPALFEEVFFRGVLQSSLVRWLGRPMIAILISSVIFSLVHFSVYLFLSRFILGLALGLMYHYTRNLWVNIAAHLFNNSIALITLFFSYSEKRKQPDENMFKTPYDYWLAGAAVFILLYLIIWLKKQSMKNINKINEQEAELVKAQQQQPFI